MLLLLLLLFFFISICTTVYLKNELCILSHNVSEILKVRAPFMNELGWTLLWAFIKEFVSSVTKPRHVSSRFYFHYISLSLIYVNRFTIK